MTMNIPANEHGVLRLFTIALPDGEVAGFNAQHGDTWPLRDALGATTLTHERVQIINTSDLADMGLARYLEDGHGIPRDQITPLRARLDGLTGHVLLLTSSALGTAAQTLTPTAPLMHIATFFEDNAPVSFDPLPDESAQKQAPAKTRKPPSDAAIGGRVATVALLIAFAVAAMMVWLA